MNDVILKTEQDVANFNNIMKLIEGSRLQNEVFQHLFWYSDELCEQLDPSQRREIFCNVLLGEKDLSLDLFDECCGEYNTNIHEVAIKDGWLLQKVEVPSFMSGVFYDPNFRGKFLSGLDEKAKKYITSTLNSDRDFMYQYTICGCEFDFNIFLCEDTGKVKIIAYPDCVGDRYVYEVGRWELEQDQFDKLFSVQAENIKTRTIFIGFMARDYSKVETFFNHHDVFDSIAEFIKVFNLTVKDVSFAIMTDKSVQDECNKPFACVFPIKVKVEE